MNKEQAQNILSMMLKIRRFEERAGAAYREQLIGGFCHLYIGQEAVIAGTQPFFLKGDPVITSYRDHAHMIACGMDLKYIMAELFGRKHGYSKGKGGSMHMFSIEKSFFGGHGIVGAQVPLGTGLAFALKAQKKTDNMTFAYLGDGACAQGQVYESFNMANLYDLPILYIIESNGYAMGTSVKRHSGSTPLHERGRAFGLKHDCVDGMDVLSVLKASKAASEYVRTTQRPYVLEVQTYRHVGHSVSDPAGYMPQSEKEFYKTRDPITNFMAYVQKQGFCTEEEVKNLDKDAKKEAKESYAFAVEDALVPEHELMRDIVEHYDN